MQGMKHMRWLFVVFAAIALMGFRHWSETANSHIAANSTRGFPGAMARSAAPVVSFTKSTFFQVFPPSVVLNTPRSALGPHVCPSAATKTVFAS